MSIPRGRNPSPQKPETPIKKLTQPSFFTKRDNIKTKFALAHSPP